MTMGTFLCDTSGSVCDTRKHPFVTSSEGTLYDTREHLCVTTGTFLCDTRGHLCVCLHGPENTPHLAVSPRGSISGRQGVRWAGMDRRQAGPAPRARRRPVMRTHPSGRRRCFRSLPAAGACHQRRRTGVTRRHRVTTGRPGATEGRARDRTAVSLRDARGGAGREETGVVSVLSRDQRRPCPLIGEQSVLTARPSPVAPPSVVSNERRCIVSPSELRIDTPGVDAMVGPDRPDAPDVTTGRCRAPQTKWNAFTTRGRRSSQPFA